MTKRNSIIGTVPSAKANDKRSQNINQEVFFFGLTSGVGWHTNTKNSRVNRNNKTKQMVIIRLVKAKNNDAL
jgi:hypothetical protein